MKRKITGYLRAMLFAALAVGIMLSANARSVTHDLTALAKIVADHHAEIEAHGHAHEDIIDLMHAYHGHEHEIVDHDHNMAFLPMRDVIPVPLSTSSSWAMARYELPDRPDHGLDRPPRV